jgi:hypothetical protein
MKRILVALAVPALLVITGCAVCRSSQRRTAVIVVVSSAPGDNHRAASATGRAAAAAATRAGTRATAAGRAASRATSGRACGECHPSYDPCVHIASDVDCEGGSGNGPVYTGRVRVIGPDEYDLDRDGDGVGCEQS